jgi:RNase P protein component
MTFLPNGSSRGDVVSTDAPPPTIGYSVSRRTGPAVVRNRLRRQLRALMREIPLMPGAYLVDVGPAGARTSSTQLRCWLVAALQDLEPVHGPG